MFIPQFLKKLISDYSSEEITRIVRILKENKIPYHLDTWRSRGSIGSALDAGAYGRLNLSLYKGGVEPSFIYSIYVKKKDLSRAHALILADRGS